MIKVRIKRTVDEAMIQEAMRVEEMGLPPLIITFIKEDVPKSREAQVRLATILKDSLEFPKSILWKFAKTFNHWQEVLRPVWEATDSSGGEMDLDSLIDRTTKLFKFLYNDIQKALNHDQNVSTGRKVYADEFVKPLDLKSIKGMRKALTKNLTKYGWPPAAGKKMSLFIDEMLIEYYNNYIRGDSNGMQLIAFLNEHPDNHKDIANDTWTDAVKFAGNYFLEKEDEDMIVKTYPKKNLFWYNIGETSCSIEAGRMGHCGADDRGILFSLRSKGSGQKASDSHVTISYNENQNTVYQIKGKQNCVPDEKYGPYIVDFLEMMEIEIIEENGEHSNCDFSEFIGYLEEEYPKGQFVANKLVELQELENEIASGQFNTQNLQFDTYLEDYADDPYITITGFVSFSVPLNMLNTDEVKERFEELFISKEDEVPDDIIDLCDFDWYDSDQEDDSAFQVRFEGDKLMIQLTLHEMEGIHHARESAEDTIGEMKRSYEEDTLNGYIEEIQQYILKEFGAAFNPETQKKMQAILEKIDELEEGYEHFMVSHDEDDNEIEFKSFRLDLPIKIPQIPLPNGVSMITNRNAYKTHVKVLGDYHQSVLKLKGDIEKAFVGAVKMKHKNAYDAASRQVSLATAGMALPTNLQAPSMVKWNDSIYIPQFVEVIVHTPKWDEIKGKATKGGFLVPKYRISFTLAITIADDITDVVWGMEYIDYLDKHLTDIMKVLTRSQDFDKIKSTVSQFHRQAVQELGATLAEQKKRVKIRIV